MEHYFIGFVEWVSDHWRVVGPIMLAMTIGLMWYVGWVFLRGVLDDIREGQR